MNQPERLKKKIEELRTIFKSINSIKQPVTGNK